MTLTESHKQFVVHWGELGSKWGINRSVAQIHALLFVANTPLTAEEISNTLSLARSNVSNSLKELQTWNLLTTTHILGDRRDHFATERDVWSMCRRIMAERKKRELEPTIAILEACLSKSEDQSFSSDVASRLDQLLKLLKRMSILHDNLQSFSNETLQALAQMGSGLDALLPRKADAKQ